MASHQLACYLSSVIEIREFITKDKPALAQIYLTCRRHTFDWIPSERFKLDDFNEDTRGERIWVAVEENHPVGFVSVWMQDSFIHHLFVHPHNQSSGVGTALLAQVLNSLGRPLRLKCVIQNARACIFYEKNGWKIESSADDGPMGPYHVFRFG